MLQLLAKAGAHRLARTLSDVAILPNARTATARTSTSMTPDTGSGMSAVRACTALQTEGGTCSPCNATSPTSSSALIRTLRLLLKLDTGELGLSFSSAAIAVSAACIKSTAHSSSSLLSPHARTRAASRATAAPMQPHATRPCCSPCIKDRYFCCLAQFFC